MNEMRQRIGRLREQWIRESILGELTQLLGEKKEYKI